MGARGQGTCASRPAGQLRGASLRCCPRPPPALREEVAWQTEGAAGRSAGPAKGAGRRPPSWARVTPPWPPPLGAGLAGGRAPRTRPASAGPGGPQISVRFCSGSGRDQILHPDRCLRFVPRARRSLSSTGDGEGEQVVSSLGGGEKEGLFVPQRGADLAPAPSGAWLSRSRVPRPAIRPGLCLASLYRWGGRGGKCSGLQPLGKLLDPCFKSGSGKHFRVLPVPSKAPRSSSHT